MLPDDLNIAQMRELADKIIEEAKKMNPNVDITKIEITFGKSPEGYPSYSQIVNFKSRHENN